MLVEKVGKNEVRKKTITKFETKITKKVKSKLTYFCFQIDTSS